MRRSASSLLKNISRTRLGNEGHIARQKLRELHERTRSLDPSGKHKMVKSVRGRPLSDIAMISRSMLESLYCGEEIFDGANHPRSTWGHFVLDTHKTHLVIGAAAYVGE